MNKIALTALAMLAGSALSTPAFAQAEARDTHFDGPYVSGIFGGAFQNNDGGDSVVFDTNRDGTYGDTVRNGAGVNVFTPGFCSGGSTSNAPGTCFGDKDGYEYGGRIGYDSRMSNIVIGGLVEVVKNESKDRTTAFSTTPAGYSFERGLDYSLAGRLRVGYTPNGGALFYATGGATYSKLKHNFFTTNTANAFTPVNADKMVWGYQYGGGAEVMVSDNISFGLEFLHNRHNDDKYYVGVTQGTAPATNPFLLNGGGTNIRPSDDRFEYNSLRLTMGLQF